jgi:hypothetical protein
MENFLARVTTDASLNGAGDKPDWVLTLADGSKIYGKINHIGGDAYRVSDSHGSVSYVNASYVVQAAIHDVQGYIDSLT